MAEAWGESVSATARLKSASVSCGTDSPVASANMVRSDSRWSMATIESAPDCPAIRSKRCRDSAGARDIWLSLWAVGHEHCRPPTSRTLMRQSLAGSDRRRLLWADAGDHFELLDDAAEYVRERLDVFGGRPRERGPNRLGALQVESLGVVSRLRCYRESHVAAIADVAVSLHVARLDQLLDQSAGSRLGDA